MSCLHPGRQPGEAEPRLRVIDALRAGAPAWLASHCPTPDQARLLGNLRRCRTAVLGGHLHVCLECGHEVPVYNSCRDRHCPACQALAQARWIEARKDILLPVGHHHVVFTLPAQLRALARANPRAIYELLFEAARDTLLTLAADDLDALLGITAILHTWNRELNRHLHLHCIVTAGGLSTDRTAWIPQQDYLFPVVRMKALFRARILEGIERLRSSRTLLLPEPEWRDIQKRLPPKDKWVVYVEPPFGRSTHVLTYLGQYTHRVAISDARVVAIGHDSISFLTRDEQVMQLSLAAFTGRFLEHVLPRGFHKIRHYGLYAPGRVRKALVQARFLLGDGDRDHPDDPPLPSTAELSPADNTWDATMKRLTGVDPLACPKCGKGPVKRLLLPRTPPRSSFNTTNRSIPRSRSPPW